MTTCTPNFAPVGPDTPALTIIFPVTTAPAPARAKAVVRGDTAIPASRTPNLLEQMARGDRDAVGRCIDQYGGLVWTLARRFCANAADAEDAVQEIFTDLWSSAPRFDPSKASETTFVAMIARRRLIDQRRKRGRTPRAEPLDGVADTSTTPEQTSRLELDEEAARAREALTTLHPQQQAAIRMSIYDGRSHREIAEQLELPIGTVKTHIRRGLLRLREQLSEPAKEVAR